MPRGGEQDGLWVFLIIALISVAFTAMMYCGQQGLDKPITVLGFGFSAFVILTAFYCGQRRNFSLIKMRLDETNMIEVVDRIFECLDDQEINSERLKILEKELREGKEVT